MIGPDNLCNSSRVVVDRIAAITGQAPRFVEGDVRDDSLLRQLFAENEISGAIHFAALKAVGESVAQPLAYYGNNLEGLVTLCSVMGEAGVKQLVFSSSATVYGNPHAVPIPEGFSAVGHQPLWPDQTDGRTDPARPERSDPARRIAYLRYFNPVGAHESGQIGEDPGGIPNNLMPYVAQVAGGRREKLMVSAVIIRRSTARACATIYTFATGGRPSCRPGISAPRGCWPDRQSGDRTRLQRTGVVKAYEAASGRTVPYEIVARRPGDIAACYADPSLAGDLLGRARDDIERMCADLVALAVDESARVCRRLNAIGRAFPAAGSCCGPRSGRKR